MAHIVLRPREGGGNELFINGVDFSYEVYNGVELVQVGDEDWCAEIGFRVTFVVSRLDIGGNVDVPLTDHFPEATALVSAATKVSE